MIKLKVRQGDDVIVITGKYKGKKGKIIKIFPDENKAIVSGINIVRKATKASQVSDGGMIAKELPIHISNIAHIDPKSGEHTKVGFRILEDGSKVRVAKKSGEIIGKDGK